MEANFFLASDNWGVFCSDVDAAMANMEYEMWKMHGVGGRWGKEK